MFGFPSLQYVQDLLVASLACLLACLLLFLPEPDLGHFLYIKLPWIQGSPVRRCLFCSGYLV